MKSRVAKGWMVLLLWLCPCCLGAQNTGESPGKDTVSRESGVRPAQYQAEEPDRTERYDRCAGGQPKYCKLCESREGKLYGMTCYGGKQDAGVLFEFDPLSGRCVSKVVFDTLKQGANPYGSLISACNGSLFGMTRSGGKFNKGVLFEFDPVKNRYHKRVDFDGENGCWPHGGLTEDRPGILYGLTTRGGRNDAGVLFCYRVREHHFDKILDFDPGVTGSAPYGDLVKTDDGMLYGMTREGGKYHYGVLFAYDPVRDTFMVLYHFDGAQSGGFPRGELRSDTAGRLYGMTASGGRGKVGVLFYYDIRNRKFVKMMDFMDKPSGICPLGSLLMTGRQQLFGMTYQGGAYSYGVIFEYDLTTGTYLKRADFDGINGKYPFGSLIETREKRIFGMTQFGGREGGGVLFEFDPHTGALIRLFDFSGHP